MFEIFRIIQILSLKKYATKKLLRKNRKNNLILGKCYTLMIYNYVKKYIVFKTLIIFEIISDTD